MRPRSCSASSLTSIYDTCRGLRLPCNPSISAMRLSIRTLNSSSVTPLIRGKSAIFLEGITLSSISSKPALMFRDTFSLILPNLEFALLGVMHTSFNLNLLEGLKRLLLDINWISSPAIDAYD